jgi:hypothetical protein
MVEESGIVAACQARVEVSPTYYSPLMAAAPQTVGRRRARPGSVERPVSSRMYRGTWLLVALPLLVAAFSVSRPTPLAPPPLPAAFDRAAALALAVDFSRSYPNRFPGTAGATGAARWFTSQLAPYGLPTRSDRFTAVVPGYGALRLENLVAEVPGRSSDAIVVMAHRDDLGIGPGANDNASGTAALVELARAYAKPDSTPLPAIGAQRVSPAHTIVFLSTDGGALGAVGAAHFAATSPYRVVAVVNLDAIAGAARARVEIAADEPRSPAASLVATAAARLVEQTGQGPRRPSALRQLIDLGLPFSLYEQAPFVARGIPALTLTTAHDRPPPAFGDTTGRLNGARLGGIGRATQELLGSLDQGLELAAGTSSYVYLGSRIVRGWAVELVLIAALLPFLAAAVDLFARCRRRRIPLAPALRSYRSRLAFWLFGGALFELFGLAGAWPAGDARPLAPETPAATHWPALALIAFSLLLFLAWLVPRERLLPRRPVTAEEELAGHTSALLALGAIALVVVATNPFALVFVLPSLHAWLWLPQLRARPVWTQFAVLAAGCIGPALLLGSFAGRYGLGLDAPWYLAELTAVGYVQLPFLVVGLAWLATAGQLAALAARRYAPYPSAAERPPRGPIREVVRRLVVAVRVRRRAEPAEPPRALHGG